MGQRSVLQESRDRCAVSVSGKRGLEEIEQITALLLRGGNDGQDTLDEATARCCGGAVAQLAPDDGVSQGAFDRVVGRLAPLRCRSDGTPPACRRETHPPVPAAAAHGGCLCARAEHRASSPWAACLYPAPLETLAHSIKSGYCQHFCNTPTTVRTLGGI